VSERGADVVVSGAGELFAEMGARWKRLARAIEEDAPPEDEDAGSLQHDSSGAFVRGSPPGTDRSVQLC
jgi:hypothetical protein